MSISALVDLDGEVGASKKDRTRYAIPSSTALSHLLCFETWRMNNQSSLVGMAKYIWRLDSP